jgi:hypothetical protein
LETVRGDPTQITGGFKHVLPIVFDEQAYDYLIWSNHCVMSVEFQCFFPDPPTSLKNPFSDLDKTGLFVVYLGVVRGGRVSQAGTSCDMSRVSTRPRTVFQE